MTTFNITRSNDQSNSNILLIGIALVAIVAVVVAFAPALFSSSTVAVEGAPFGNGSNDGNWVAGTTGDGRLEGTPPNLNIYQDDSSTTVDNGSTTFVVDCSTGIVSAGSPVETDAAGNYQNIANGLAFEYSSDGNFVRVYEIKDGAYNQWIFNIGDCFWGEKTLVQP